MDQLTGQTDKTRDRLVDITLDPKSLGRANPNIEHEREVAIFDILDGNAFRVDELNAGPYRLSLALAEDKLLMAIASAETEASADVSMQLAPLKKIMKDYFMICESYYEAVRTAPPAKIQAIDVNRRGLHDEGSMVLREKIAPRVVVDDDTARRLFTLVCSLHWKG